VKTLFLSIARLGTGEAAARLASFALYAYISRVFGIELLGIVALAQTIATYVTLGTDQGLRMIGARLVARDASAAPEIIRHVLRKRLISCAVCVSLGVLYGWKGPVPANARLYILGLVLGVIPYAFSLDWLAWGLDHFGWLGAWRAGVSFVFAISAIGAIHFTGSTLLPITIANAESAALGAVLLWALWRFRWQSILGVRPKHGENGDVGSHFRWAVVLPLGASTILNLMFNNFDTVMLGAMTSAREVGRYSAAYKILFLIFGGYYLMTQSLYPKLSRMKGGAQARPLLLRALIGLIAFGACIALVIAVCAAPILRIVYGADFNSVHLVRILSLAVPMEFCVALMGTVLVSRGFNKLVLLCTASAAVLNVVLNWFLIPRLRADGAAWSTVGSYLLLFILVLAIFAAKPALLDEPASSVVSRCSA
jgi:O-antigen/teichoic acid export membrane protein